MNRNARLFASILNYIQTTSAVYQYVKTLFANDGRGLFNYLWEFGHLPYTPEELEILNNTWNEATMSKVNIKFNSSAIFKWMEWVLNEAAKTGKTNAQIRTRFLAGSIYGGV